MEFESREEAWEVLVEALSAMLQLPKKDWPEDVEERRAVAGQYLEENPATPATAVTLNLSKQSLTEVAQIVQQVVQSTLGPIASTEVEGTTANPPWHGQIPFTAASPEPPTSRVYVDDPAVEVAVVMESGESEEEVISPRSPLAGSQEELPDSAAEYWDEAPDHNCRAELDVDDICLVCGRHVPTGPVVKQ